jgi:hypothetical protein
MSSSKENGRGERRAIARAVAVSLVFAAAGFAALTAGNGFLGSALFVVLPAAAAFVAASSVGGGQATLIASLLSLTLCLSSLLVLGLEGIVCVGMAFPLILVSAAVGALLGRILQRRRPAHPLVALLFASLMVACADRLERPLKPRTRMLTVATSATVPGTPQEVWPAVLTIDKVSGPRPFLLRIGLPVPTSCRLEGRGVGARRVCQFENGVIEERVTEWEPPRRMRARITRSTLPGRHWLGFVDATYELEPWNGDRTHVMRTTTISSSLRPDWYWSFFEALGTQSEHAYILGSLAIELESRKNTLPHD